MAADTHSPDNHFSARAAGEGPKATFHPLHAQAALATHSRPAIRVHAPATVEHAVLLVGEADSGQGGRAVADDRAGFIQTIEKRGWTVAQQTESEILAVSTPHAIKWERHTEFIALTCFFMHEDSQSGATSQDIEFNDFLSDLASYQPDGAEIFARMRIGIEQESELNGSDPAAIVSAETPDGERSQSRPSSARSSANGRTDPMPNDPALIKVLVNGDAICVATDLRHDGEGVVQYRAALSSQRGDQLPPARIGRFVQRLIEIETYRLLAYLAVPKTQAMGARVSALEGKVNRIAERTAAQPEPHEEAAILSELTSLSAELQSIGSASEFRFAASLAYSAIVDERMSELRESRIEAHMRLSDAIRRRLDPAMRSCEALLARQQKIAERIGNITELLRTRVDLTLQDQNGAVLRSIDARADAQLRLQQTVEGLSVAAITYYLLGIIGYLVKGAPLQLIGMSYSAVQALLVLPVGLLVYFGLKKARHKAEQSDHEKPSKKGSSGGT